MRILYPVNNQYFRFKPIFFLVGILLLSACAQYGRYIYKNYPLPENNDIALLLVKYPLRVSSIDGKYGLIAPSISEISTTKKLNPGGHRLLVGFDDGHGRRSLYDLDLTIEAEGGHTYEIEYEISDISWTASIKDVTEFIKAAQSEGSSGN